MGKSKKETKAEKKAPPPKQESSDDSSSSEEVQKAVATKGSKPAPVAAKKPESSSSDSDSDSSSEEKPKAKAATPAKDAKQASKTAAAPAKGTPAKAAPPAKAAKKQSSSSDSSSDSSSEEEAPKKGKKAAPPAKEAKKEAPKEAPKKEAKKDDKKKKSSSSDSSSESESSSESMEVEAKGGVKRKADDAPEQPPQKKQKVEEKPAAPAAGASCTVFVGNLNFKIDDATITEFFKDCGEITKINWVQRDGKFRGIGFLDFATPEAAQAAAAKNGQECMERPIKAEIAAPKPDRAPAAGKARPGSESRPKSVKAAGCDTCFIGNLSFEITEDDVRDFFKDCGEVVAVRWVERDGQFKGCGFVQFGSSDSTDRAVALSDTKLKGRPIRVDFSNPKN